MGGLAWVVGGLLGLGVLSVVGLWLWLRAPDIPLAELEARWATPASRYLDLDGGVRVHYREDGAAAAPVVLLLHGFGDSHTSFEHWWPALAASNRVITLDFPGHGLTAAPADYSLRGDALADLVDAFAARLGLGAVVVVGNSMGGGVAWRLAVRHPERVRGLVLLDAAGFPAEGPSQPVPLAFRLLQYSWGRAFLASIDNTPLIREGLRKDVVDPAVITEAFVARWASFQRAPGHRQILMGVDFSDAAGATPEVLRKITAPTLVLHGAQDIIIPPTAAHQFAAAIPGATLKLYPNAGHLPQVEIPAQSVADVLAFVQRLPAL